MAKQEALTAQETKEQLLWVAKEMLTSNLVQGTAGNCAARLPADERPDSYWADDVVAGIIASARALIGVDELHARTEARYSGPMKRVSPEDEPA